jgi:peptidoglycan/xylan/chitin deacetylase (PgdA/CDA1 family)
MRRLAPSLLLLAVALIFLLVAVAIGGGSSRPATARASTPASRQGQGHGQGHGHRPARPATASRLVTNATPQPDWRPYTGPVPILVYHDLGNAPASEPYPGLYLPDADFTTEMQWLHDHGYQAVTLDEVMNAWYHDGTLPAKPIVITFDNGYIPQATFAPSVMSRYGWPGVLNEITAGHLSNARIESLLAIGWEVDSHSINHPDLTTLTPSALQYQLVASRNYLRHTFHIESNSFCYPSSKYNAAVVAAVQAAGYTNATTENAGFATRANPFLLDRFEIESGVAELASDLAADPSA